MTGYNGRDLLIQLGSPAVTIAAVQAKEITRAREAVDTTNDDDDGWRSVLAEPGVRNIDINITGVANTTNYEDLLERWNDDTGLQDATIVHPDGSTESGSFFMSNLAHGGESGGFVTFTADLISSGEITYDDGSS